MIWELIWELVLKPMEHVFWSWFGACFDGGVDDMGAGYRAGMKALRALGALSRLRVIHTWAQGSQGHQGQLGPSGPNHISRAGLQTADVLSLT